MTIDDFQIGILLLLSIELKRMFLKLIVTNEERSRKRYKSFVESVYKTSNL